MFLLLQFFLSLLASMVTEVFEPAMKLGESYSYNNHSIIVDI